MRARPFWLLLPALTACDRGGEAAASDAVAVVARPVIASPTPHALAVPTIDHVERVSARAAAPPAPATPSGPMRPTRDFTDPPLPPELTDDGGLAPLPPRPRPAPIQAEEAER